MNYQLNNSLASIRWITPRLNKFFNSQGWERPVILSQGSPFVWPSTGPCHVVLLGDFFENYNHIERWFPVKKGYYIWVLAERFRQVLIQLFNFPPRHVGVIPRSFFGKDRTQRKVNFLEPQTFVYAGRLLAEKNVISSIRFAHKISLLQNTDFKFIIYSQDFNEPENKNLFLKKISRAGIKHSSIKLATNDFWFSEKLYNPILINFSTSFTEDFSVSVRLAKLAGWPILTSDWGALSEERGVSCWQIPLSMSGSRGAIRFLQNISHYNGAQINQSLIKPSVCKYFQLRSYLGSENPKIEDIKNILKGLA